MKYIALFLSLILLKADTDFVPIWGPGTISNGLLNNLNWYCEFEDSVSQYQSIHAISAGADHYAYSINSVNWGSSAGVINNARVKIQSDLLLQPSDFNPIWGPNSFTISGWVNFASFVPDSQVIISSWDSGNSDGLFRLIETNNAGTKEIQFQLRKSDNSAFTIVAAHPTVAMATGTWYYIAAGFDSINGQIFIVTETIGGTLPALTTATFTGSRRGGTSQPAFEFGGDFKNSTSDTATELTNNSLLDEWAGWGTVLTSAQFLKLYAKTPYSSFQN